MSDRIQLKTPFNLLSVHLHFNACFQPYTTASGQACDTHLFNSADAGEAQAVTFFCILKYTNDI